MSPFVKLLIPTVLCTVWCGACVWYAQTYLGAGREIVPLISSRRTYRMSRFNATTLTPTVNERVAMVENINSLMTWKLMIEPLNPPPPASDTTQIELLFEVREVGKEPVLLYRTSCYNADPQKLTRPFPLLVGIMPQDGTITSAEKLKFRVAQEGSALCITVDNPFKTTRPVSYGDASSPQAGIVMGGTATSLPLYQTTYEDKLPKQQKVLFLRIERTRSSASRMR